MFFDNCIVSVSFNFAERVYVHRVSHITSKHVYTVWMVMRDNGVRTPNICAGTCQASRGVGWMPRGQGPKKDAARGETWAGSCSQAMSRPNPNGATRERGSACTGS